MGGETIAAIATPPGRGGIGVVRVSGPEALAVTASMLRLKAPPAAGRARLGQVVDPATGAAVDEAVVTYFAGPRSYTGEDVVEISCHGAPVLLDMVLGWVLAAGARLARAGEFTERAYLSGRLDLAQAEAVRDLVDASTAEQARVAAAQLGGWVARALAPAKDGLLNLIAELEAGVDFAEDDLDLLPDAAVAGRIGALRGPVEALAASFGYGRVLREGFRLAIVGRPNAGKSSLFNRLLGQERAIVTAQAGTTRDTIGETFSLGGIPVRLEDTAGLREAPSGPEGEAERAGIVRAGEALAEADAVLLVVDATTLGPAGELAGEDAATLAGLAVRPHLLVLNKCDLVLAGPVSGGLASDGLVSNGLGARVSALTGVGMSALQEALLGLVAGPAPALGFAVLTNVRQHAAVSAVARALGRAERAAEDGLPHELLLLDLREALEAMDEVTGATGSEEVLERIFAGFCIGK